MTKVVIIENQDWMIDGLCSLLKSRRGFKVSAAGNDGYDSLRFAEIEKPDIMIVRLEMPHLSGLKLVKSIKLRSPETAIIILGKEVADADVIDFVSSGAEGFILQDSVFDEIFPAIERILVDKCYFLSHEVASKIVCLYSKHLKTLNQNSGNMMLVSPNIRMLEISKAEMQVAIFIGEGLTNREIAQRISMSEGTIRNYVSSILQKSGFRHRTQIAIHVNSNGFSVRDGREKFMMLSSKSSLGSIQSTSETRSVQPVTRMTRASLKEQKVLQRRSYV